MEIVICWKKANFKNATKISRVFYVKNKNKEISFIYPHSRKKEKEYKNHYKIMTRNIKSLSFLNNIRFFIKLYMSLLIR